MSDPLDVASPEAILALSPPEADTLLEELERSVPRQPPLVRVGGDVAKVALVFGDTHGDWRSTEALFERFAAEGPSLCLVGLGDYIDRAPLDCGAGSVANAMFLLRAVGRAPNRVTLLQGNHETARRIGVRPHDLPEEIEELWGPRPDRYTRLMDLLERGPLAATTASGAYLAHAGFPRGPLPDPWARSFDRITDNRLVELVWSECDRSRNRRGGVPPWTRVELDHFLGATGLSVVVRGHDPDISGVPLYDDRVLTLQTTRTYERFGGVLAGELPLDRPVRSVRDIPVSHLRTEGRKFPRPSA